MLERGELPGREEDVPFGLREVELRLLRHTRVTATAPGKSEGERNEHIAEGRAGVMAAAGGTQGNSRRA